MGHSGCGGVKGCHGLCKSGEVTPQESPLMQWIDGLRPAYAAIKDIAEDAQLEAMEKAGVLLSLTHLEEYPWVKEAQAAESLALHGLWYDIRSGRVEGYNPATQLFEPL